jgi:hypothetical protein
MWDHTDCRLCYFRGCPFSCTGPGQLPDRASVISGDLQAGGNSICLCLTGVLLLPSRRQPWTLACVVCTTVHFRDSYPIDVSHLSFNFSLSAVSLGIYLCGSCQATVVCLFLYFFVGYWLLEFHQQNPNHGDHSMLKILIETILGSVFLQ